MLKIKKTKFKDLLIIEGKSHNDERGYLRELLIEKQIKQKFKFQLVSKSRSNVLRGLHFQYKKPQGKFISVIKGKIFDVAVDIRKNSKTYGKHVAVLLSGENKRQLFVPRGFAHGFLVLSDSATFAYKVDNRYAPEFDAGIRWYDKELNIQWGLEESEVLVSAKDAELPFF